MSTVGAVVEELERDRRLELLLRARRRRGERRLRLCARGPSSSSQTSNGTSRDRTARRARRASSRAPSGCAAGTSARSSRGRSSRDSASSRRRAAPPSRPSRSRPDTALSEVEQRPRVAARERSSSGRSEAPKSRVRPRRVHRTHDLPSGSCSEIAGKRTYTTVAIRRSRRSSSRPVAEVGRAWPPSPRRGRRGDRERREVERDRRAVGLRVERALARERERRRACPGTIMSTRARSGRSARPRSSSPPARAARR